MLLPRFAGEDTPGAGAYPPPWSVSGTEEGDRPIARRKTGVRKDALWRGGGGSTAGINRLEDRIERRQAHDGAATAVRAGKSAAGKDLVKRLMMSYRRTS